MRSGAPHPSRKASLRQAPPWECSSIFSKSTVPAARLSYDADRTLLQMFTRPGEMLPCRSTRIPICRRSLTAAHLPRALVGGGYQAILPRQCHSSVPSSARSFCHRLCGRIATRPESHSAPELVVSPPYSSWRLYGHGCARNASRTQPSRSSRRADANELHGSVLAWQRINDGNPINRCGDPILGPCATQPLHLLRDPRQPRRHSRRCG